MKRNISRNVKHIVEESPNTSLYDWCSYGSIVFIKNDWRLNSKTRCWPIEKCISCGFSKRLAAINYYGTTRDHALKLNVERSAMGWNTFGRKHKKRMEALEKKMNTQKPAVNYNMKRFES